MKKKIFNNCYLTELPKYGNNKRGFLTAMEVDKEIPFQIKRVYYIYGIGNLSEIRGPHAHKQTEQYFVNVKGKATYHLDNGVKKKIIKLDKPNTGIYIGPKIWHYMNDFSDDIILLAVASSYFDENDYLREYNEFIKFLVETS